MRPVSRRTDYYDLCYIVYCLLTGYNNLSSPTVLQLAMVHNHTYLQVNKVGYARRVKLVTAVMQLLFYEDIGLFWK